VVEYEKKRRLFIMATKTLRKVRFPKTTVKINIRKMTHEDIDGVLEFNSNLKGHKNILTARDMVAINPGGPMDCSFVAEAKGKIIGFIIARVSYGYLPSTEACLINGMVVDTKYRRQYIGTRLVNELLQCCRSEEIPTVRGLVDERNEELKRVVENLGFQRSKIVNYDRIFEI
jgi:ribosomal protein S18 acetylase RimI-like enzyme